MSMQSDKISSLPLSEPRDEIRDGCSFIAFGCSSFGETEAIKGDI